MPPALIIPEKTPSGPGAFQLGKEDIISYIVVSEGGMAHSFELY